MVADSYPGKEWEDIVDDYENDEPPGFRGQFDRNREIAVKGTSAWLPKPVRSAVRLGMDFVQVFLFLSLTLFHRYFPSGIVDKLKNMQTVKLFNCQNKEEEGLLLRPTAKGRGLNSPEVRLWRESVLYIEEDLCPSNQIREGGSKDVWTYQFKNRVATRDPALKDEGCVKAPSFEKLQRLVQQQAKEEKAKHDAGQVESVSSEGEQEGTAHRGMVHADIDAEAPAKKKKLTKKDLRKKSQRKMIRRGLRRSILGMPGGPNADGTGKGVSKVKGEVTTGGGEASDDDAEKASGEESCSGSEREIQKRTRMPVELICRGVIQLGNRIQGVVALAAPPVRFK